MTSSLGGRRLIKKTTLALACATMLSFAALSYAQDPSASDPAGSDVFATSGLTDSPLAPDGAASAAGATIASDQADYSPGSTVTLTGSGWRPGESVRIVVDDDGLQEQAWQRDMTVTANADGTIGDLFELPLWFVANYTVTATGADSGSATTTFTDAINFGGCVSSAPSNASGTITVNTTTDEFNSTANATCSLREAIRTANNDAAADTIVVPAGTYTLTIVGAGARTTFVQAGTTAANGIDRVFDVRTGGLTMSGVTVRHGRVGDDGAGFRVRDFSGTVGLTLTDVTVADNTTTGGNDGGGIHNSNTTGGLVLSRVTVSGNVAGRDAGGILNADDASLTNVTITNNSATGSEQGGGLFNNGIATLTNVTVSHNSTGTGGAGGGLHRQGGTLQLRNTIVANNTVGVTANANCSGTITNTSNNLDSGTTCAFTTANGSKSSANADLGALQDNGGPTNTRALGASSAATDAGTATGAPNVDQRGVSRPQGAGYDIGAFEFASVTLTKVNGSNVT